MLTSLCLFQSVENITVDFDLSFLRTISMALVTCLGTCQIISEAKRTIYGYISESYILCTTYVIRQEF